MGKMKIAVICAMLFMLGMALSTVTAQEGPDAYWPVQALGDWDCGVRGVTIRRTSQGINNHALWESFHVRLSDGKFSPAPPRKLILTYDTHTERLTLNGKRNCEQSFQRKPRKGRREIRLAEKPIPERLHEHRQKQA